MSNEEICTCGHGVSAHAVDPKANWTCEAPGCACEDFELGEAAYAPPGGLAALGVSERLPARTHKYEAYMSPNDELRVHYDAGADDLRFEIDVGARENASVRLDAERVRALLDDLRARLEDIDFGLRPAARLPGLRACEKCDGPGPSLWDSTQQRYVCRGCHAEPDDPFFAAP